jgi:hypothetical protein
LYHGRKIIDFPRSEAEIYEEIYDFLSGKPLSLMLQTPATSVYMIVVEYMMKNIILIFILSYILGCSYKKEESKSQLDKLRPISKLEKIISDSLENRSSSSVPQLKSNRNLVVIDREKQYRNDTINHPLRPFYLSYEEWKTIGCIISINENTYHNKLMIGLIERSNNLRIKIDNKKTYLKPESVIKFKNGLWKNVYKNDTISVKIWTELTPCCIMRTISGNGTIELQINDKTYTETAYFVAKIK